MNNNMMRLAHLLATEPQFQVTCATDAGVALAQWGLTLTDQELAAFDRVQALIEGVMNCGGLVTALWPDGKWYSPPN